MGRVLGFLFPPGSRPFDHRRGLLNQPGGQVRVVEGLDVRVRRGLLHPDGGPASFERHDDAGQYRPQTHPGWVSRSLHRRAARRRGRRPDHRRHRGVWLLENRLETVAPAPPVVLHVATGATPARRSCVVPVAAVVDPAALAAHLLPVPGHAMTPCLHRDLRPCDSDTAVSLALVDEAVSVQTRSHLRLIEPHGLG